MSDKGTVDQAKGRVKKAAGELFDDDDMKREGSVDETSGKVKEKLSNAKDKATDAVDRVKDGIKDRTGGDS